VSLPILCRKSLLADRTSAQSERDFSSVGRTVTDARSRLSLQTVEAMELIQWGLLASMITNVPMYIVIICRLSFLVCLSSVFC